MTADSIKEARDSTPFKPFALRTADGHESIVPNHHSLFFAEQGRVVIVGTSDKKFHSLATEMISNITR